MSRTRYVAFRVLQTVALLWFVLTFLFFFFRLMPGDVVDLFVHGGATEEQVEAFREAWGLNDPLWVQYLHYLKNFLMLDVGTSIQFNKPVWDYVSQKIFNSFILVAPAITLAYILGTIFGTVMGSQRGSKLEKYGIIGVLSIGAIPDFVLAIFAVVIFGEWLNVVPVGGMVSVEALNAHPDAPWWRIYFTKSFLLHYILPFLVISIKYLYLPLLIMRTSVVETMGQDFIYYHRMTGIPKLNILQHIGKHSILPVITLYPVTVTRALSGLVLVELVFNWPGIGFALVQAVLSRDFPVVQFVFFLVAAFVIIANFGVDLIYGVIDPRVEEA